MQKETINPFIVDYKLEVIRTFDKYVRTKGPLPEEITTYYDFEIQEKTSLYKFVGDDHKVFKDLKSIGRDMLLYITYNLVKGKDSIKLPFPTIEKSMGITRSTYYKGISQLVECNFICRKGSSEYWINPQLIFCGSRVDYFTEKGDEYLDIKKTNGKPKY